MIFLLCLQCSVNAWVYSNVLIKPDHILGPMYKWISNRFTYWEKLPAVDIPDEVKNMPGFDATPQKVCKKKSHWILKPLGDCYICTAGNFSLWAYLTYIFLPIISLDGYIVARTAWYGLTTICTSILLVMILHKFMHDATQN